MLRFSKDCGIEIDKHSLSMILIEHDKNQKRFIEEVTRRTGLYSKIIDAINEILDFNNQ